MSSKALLLPYTAIANPKHTRRLILTILAVFIVLSAIYAVLINAIAGAQYRISSLNKEVVSQAAELARNQALLLNGVNQPSNEAGITAKAENIAMQNINSDLSYIHSDSVFADASRPLP
ncbi:MAG: hypothetical protein HYT39_03240 [Candidatus Sungbacteria bacterium]|nr:hypothetical protein [Candidatus Sungbacteria bacterium]